MTTAKIPPACANPHRRDEGLRIGDLGVQVEGRVVTLTGRAETPVQCWRALQTARYVAGLARVSNRTVVRPRP